ncbi:MAG: haloacid dehalogenase-like hydrolase [Candidatus Rokubacteria bacterium]|nr:haloacid dehalogenase-like hydrolase [Candidatus Rokubacteria bacterium]
MRLFLFDVDGTLVTARGAGRQAFARALAATYGVTGPIERYDFRGKTDLCIVRDLMAEAGVSAAAVEAGVDACFTAYARELEALLADGTRLLVMPGVVELVAALGARPDALVGLLTGNIEAGARLKLRPTGLWPRFRVGAFGSDDADRRRLPAVALERAWALTGRDFPPDRVTIIGDTPLDVDCARACGARAVAVATGFHPYPELEASAPDLLFGDFSDVAAALAALTA